MDANIEEIAVRVVPEFISMSHVITISPPSAERVVDATHLPVIIDAFFDDKGRTVSERTIEDYRNDMRPFLQWWRECETIHGGRLSAEALENFLRWCKSDYRNSFGQPPSSYTLRRVTKRLRQILMWAHNQGYVPVAIHEMVTLYHDPGREKYYPSISELARLLHAPRGIYRVRDAALMAFAISTGARRMEIAHARIENLTFATPLEDLSCSSDHSGHILLRVVKGDRSGEGLGRLSVFDWKAGLLVKAWLRSSGEEAGSLFGLGIAGIQKIVRDASMLCELPDLHPHAFRSALIDYWVDKHMDSGAMADIALKLQVGHAIDKSVATNHYIDYRNRRKILRWLQHYHTSPLEEIDIDWIRYPVHIEP